MTDADSGDRSKPCIPVPEVFAHDSNPSNEVSVAYMFLEYIHGTTADELAERCGSPLATFGTAT